MYTITLSFKRLRLRIAIILTWIVTNCVRTGGMSCNVLLYVVRAAPSLRGLCGLKRLKEESKLIEQWIRIVERGTFNFVFSSFREQVLQHCGCGCR